MLEQLSIRNLAVIDRAEIPFEAGLNVLSGETGAGKSIVLEAISLLLGSRASQDLVRTGCDEAVVEGSFDLKKLTWVRERLREAGLPESGDSDRPCLLIKRTVHRQGKHRIAINGESATLSVLAKVCEGLIDLCGQHEHQSLLRPGVQLELLDRYGGLEELRASFGERFTVFRETAREISALEISLRERERQRDFLTFQIDELRSAGLSPGEEETLTARKQLLQSATQRAQGVQAAMDAVDREDGGAIRDLKIALQRLRPLALLDPSLLPVIEALDRATLELDDAGHALRRYADSVELDPAELETVQERLALLAELRRKYGQTSKEMLSRLSDLEEELGTLENADSKLADLLESKAHLFKDLSVRAQHLTKKRTAVAKALAASVTAELKELNMAEAQFLIAVEPRAGTTEADLFQHTGADSVNYSVQTNRGDSARALGKIASGGELSRLMLAIRRVISDRGGIGVYLFDEIDAGIGGQTAFQVGRKLKSVARANQVLCITHLPQVAAFADHHLVVRKAAQGKVTLTEVQPLSTAHRKEELARMLGGAELTKKSLANASDLLRMAREA